MNEYAKQGQFQKKQNEKHKDNPKLDTSWVKRKFCDIQYGVEYDSQKLDLYLPEEGEGPFPLIAFIHGGGFQGGSRDDLQLKPFLEAIKDGYIVASIDHPLSGETVFPNGILSCKAALRYLETNARNYKIDTENIAVAGNSAGGNFALMLAATQNQHCLGVQEMNSYADTRIHCAVIWYAPIDFWEMDRMLIENGMGARADHSMPHSPESDYLGGDMLKLDPEFVRSAGPTPYITRDFPPTLLQQGTKDMTVAYQQAVNFTNHVNRLCGEERVVLTLLENAGHGGAEFESPENWQRVVKFLDSHLKSH